MERSNSDSSSSKRSRGGEDTGDEKSAKRQKVDDTEAALKNKLAALQKKRDELEKEQEQESRPTNPAPKSKTNNPPSTPRPATRTETETKAKQHQNEF